jgi:histidinol dehydrogenase
MLRLKTSDPDFETKFSRLVNDRRESDADVSRTVGDILLKVRSHGDEAVIEHTMRFDNHPLRSEEDWRVAPEACEHAFNALEAKLREALELAAERIRAYHEHQLPNDRDFTDEAGVRMGARWRAVDAAGLYVPGGRAAYPSSLLMNAIPAKVAGVERLVVVTPTPKGEINPLVLAAAHLVGIEEIWRIGGAQAIGALAYGTERIKPVDVIVGPGNAYVAEAKRQLYGVVGIDMVAGPSEIVVVADGANDPAWIAADLLSQAEHDADAQVLLVSDSGTALNEIVAEVERQVETLPRAAIARASLEQARAIRVADMTQACEVANLYGPEHLSIQAEEAELLVEKITAAGAVFVGQWAAVTLGDYAAGPSHVLPTDGGARTLGGITTASFMTTMSVQTVTQMGAAALAPVAARLARMEGLEAHARAADLRTEA